MSYKRIYYIVLNFLIYLGCIPMIGQVDSIDTSNGGLIEVLDSSISAIDTLPIDFFAPDSAGIEGIMTGDSLKLNIEDIESDPISQDGLDREVDYGARDTQWYDHIHKQMHLYGDAYVNYDNMELTAGYIVFNIESNTAEAFSIENEEGKEIQKPTFVEGDNSFTYEQLKYNFKTKKGIVKQAVTQEGDLYVLGANTKFIGKDSDTLIMDDVIYNENALITSCNHDHPHFGIRTKKLKVIPKKVGVTGPAQLEIAGVPTPLWLPFGFFPLAKGRSTGLIFPSDFPYEDDRGFGVRGLGWYFPINDYLDLVLKGDVYTRGSWLANSTLNYRKRYKYNGNVRINFSDNVFESQLDASRSHNRSFALNITHNQDQKAHPYRNIGGSINFSTKNFAQQNYNDANSVLNNTYTSNFRFKHSMPNTPFNFSLGLSHNQNTNTQVINITLPEVDLRSQTMYPFKSKKSGSNKQKWYELISLKYESKAANYIKTTDTTFLSQEMYDNMRFGVKQKATTQASFQAFKYITISPNATYDEYWLFRTLEQRYDAVADKNISTTIPGFRSYRNYNAGISSNTQLFGTILFNKSILRGFRHTVKPSASFSLGPDTESRYREEVFYGDEFISNYNPFQNGPFGTPSLSGETQNLNLGIGNVLEMKYFSKRDSMEKKVRLLESFNIRSNYNFAADSTKWDPVTLSSNTRIFKRYTKLGFKMTLDPYTEVGNTRIQQYSKDELNQLLRIDRWQIEVTTGFSLNQLVDLFRGKASTQKGKKQSKDNESEFTSADPKLLDMFGKLRIEHKFLFGNTTRNNDEISLEKRHLLGIRGSIDISDNWGVRIDNFSYDFIGENLVYPSFTFSRKLHCWNMNFSWAPNRDSYSFYIGVNSSTLEFLKYNYGQNNVGLGNRF